MNLDGQFANERFTQETDEPACPNCDCRECWGEADPDCDCECHYRSDYDGTES